MYGVKWFSVLPFLDQCCEIVMIRIFREAAYLVKIMSETGTFTNKDRQFKGYLLTRLTIKEDFV